MPAWRIDAHVHLWDIDRRDQPWVGPSSVLRRSFDIDDLHAATEDCEVGHCVLVQVLNRRDETLELLECARDPLIAGVVAWADLHDPAIADVLSDLAERGPLIGVRHQALAEPDAGRWLRSAGAGLDAVEQAGLPFDLIIRPEHAADALHEIRGHPSLHFVLDHLAKPPIATGQLEPWRSRLAALAGEENVSCKLSGMVTVAGHQTWTTADLRPYGEVALDLFGPDRLMAGSDWPVCTQAAGYRDVVDAMDELLSPLSPTEQDAVWRTTAARTYRLRG